LLLSLAFLLNGAVAHGQDAEAQARTYFNIGAKAYQAGKYEDAIQAFQEAYKKSPRAGLVFSMAQAYRMQYFASNDRAHLKNSIHFYREYLKKEASGPRAGDSQQALATLVPILERLEGAGAAENMAAPAQSGSGKPMVMINSPLAGVKVAFDGKAGGELPFVRPVAAGKHRFTLSKAGYDDYSREFVVDPRTGVPPFDIPLVEKPASLTVAAPEGAEISIDGRPQGEAPLPAIALKPGRHFVAVTMNGREPFTREVDLRRGERRRLAVDLESTGQRTAAWIMMGAGAGGMIAGGVLGFFALDKESDAQAILDDAESQGNQSEARRREYEELRDDRDQLRLAAVITAGAGLAVTTTGILLFALDSPKVRVPARDEGPSPEPETAPPSSAPTMEVSAAPLWAPGFAGAALNGRF
jgi:tetratricopeptide (TPR) repeat protein